MSRRTPAPKPTKNAQPARKNISFKLGSGHFQALCQDLSGGGKFVANNNISIGSHETARPIVRLPINAQPPGSRLPGLLWGCPFDAMPGALPGKNSSGRRNVPGPWYQAGHSWMLLTGFVSAIDCTGRRQTARAIVGLGVHVGAVCM